MSVRIDDIVARLGCADRIERCRALDEVFELSGITDAKSIIASDERCLAHLSALLDPRTGDEASCFVSLVTLCNLSELTTLIQNVVNAPRCVACTCELSEADHSLISTRAFRLLLNLSTSESVQMELSQNAAFRRSIIGALNSHNTAVVEISLTVLMRSMLGSGGPNYSLDVPLRDSLVILLRGTGPTVARMAAACVQKLSSLDSVGSAHHPHLLEAIGSLMISEDYDLQQSGVSAALQMSNIDANVIALARNQQALDGLVLMLCSSEMPFILGAAKTLANLCRHTDNHAILAAHPRCLHHVSELLNSNNEELLISSANILWNLSARMELRAAVAGCHPRLFSMLHSVLIAWDHSPAVLLASVSILHHLSAVGAGRDGIAVEDGYLDTLLTLANGGNLDIQCAAAGALQNLTFAPSLRLYLAHHVRYMQTMSAFLQHDDDSLRKSAASAIWNLAAHQPNRTHIITLEYTMNPLIQLYMGQSMDVLELVVNTFWHLSSEPSNRPQLAETPGFISGAVEIVRVGVDENIRKGLLHIICNLSLDEGVRVLLPNQRGLLTFLVRTMIDEAPALQRPAVCAIFQMTIPPQCREAVAATPMCIPALIGLCRSDDEAIQELAAGALHNMTLTPSSRAAVMKDSSAAETLASIWSAPRLATVRFASVAISNIVQSPEYRIHIGAIANIFALLKALSSRESEDIAKAASATISRLAQEQVNRKAMLNVAGFIEAVVILLYHDNSSVQNNAAGTLWSLSLEEPGRPRIISARGALDGFANVLESPDNATVEAVVSILWNCAVDPTNHIPIANHPVLLDRLTATLNTRNRKITKATLCCLSHVSIAEESKRYIVNTNNLLLGIVNAIRNTLVPSTVFVGSERWDPGTDFEIQLPGITVLRNVCSISTLSYSTLTTPTCLAVLEALLRSTDVAISLATVSTLQFCVNHPENRVVVALQEGLLDSIVISVQSRHTDIQYTAAGILPPLSFDPSLQEILAKHNGFVEATLGLMRTASLELISFGTNTLWNLSACDSTRTLLINKLGVSDDLVGDLMSIGVLDTMTRVLCFRPPHIKHQGSQAADFADILHAVLATLCNFSIPPETRPTIASRRALLEAVVPHLEHPSLHVKDTARKALARLFETSAASPEPVLPYLDSLVEILRQRPSAEPTRR